MMSILVTELSLELGFHLMYKIFRIAPLRGAGLSNFEATRISPRWGEKPLTRPKKVYRLINSSCNRFTTLLNSCCKK
jgi:hypothetical protein